jgi:hypothetical protein
LPRYAARFNCNRANAEIAEVEGMLPSSD